MYRKTYVLLFFTLLATNLFGTTYYFTNNAQIKFRSDAPQEVISASSSEMRGLIDTEKKTFVFKVLIRTFVGFNSALQEEHFNDKFLESEKYPEAVFNGKIIEDIDFSVSGEYTIRAKGKLLIHGVEHERIIKTELEIKDGVITFKSTFSVLLADFNIKVPKVVHEKIASEIRVDVSGILKKKILN
ncbi:MAG: YceI family protein [Bacteroidia bacterium]|nr:YceI family protein [Bacteroidia bacterium]